MESQRFQTHIVEKPDSSKPPTTHSEAKTWCNLIHNFSFGSCCYGSYAAESSHFAVLKMIMLFIKAFGDD